MLILNNSPLLPNFNAPKIELDTKIADIYEKSQIFLEKYPEIWESIKNDFDNYALMKKKMRIADKEYEEYQKASTSNCLSIKIPKEPFYQLKYSVF